MNILGFLSSLTFFSVILLLCACSTYEQDYDLSYSSETLHTKQVSTYIRPAKGQVYPPEYDIFPGDSAQLEKQNYLPALNTHRFHSFTLKNGLQVFYLPIQKLPVISMAAVIDTGNNHKAYQNVLPEMVLKLLKQGTEKYDKTTFQEQASLLGNPIHYKQTSRFSVMSIDVMSHDLNLALSLFEQQLSALKPDDRSYEKIIEQQLLENKMNQSSGFYLAKQSFYRDNYPESHPYYRTAISSSDIKKITMEQLQGFYNTFYSPGNLKLIIVGDINVKQLKKLTETFFLHWSPVAISSIGKMDYPEVFQHKDSQINVIHRSGAQQADILYGVVTVEGSSPDRMALDIIATMLGGGPGSRMFADLREKKGLTYGISARQLKGQYHSPFFIQSSVAHEKVIDIIKGISGHINELCQSMVSGSELNMVKEQLRGEILLGHQTRQQRVNQKVIQLEIDSDEEYIAEQFRQLDLITPDLLFQVTRKYLCKPHQFIIVGDKSRLVQPLNKQFKDK